MESAVLVALAGLLGVAIGRLWDSRSESARWRRDRRVQVYERLAAIFYVRRDALRFLALTVPGTADADAATERFLGLGPDWNRDVVAVWLYGSEVVTAAVQPLDQKMTELYLRAAERQFSAEEFREVRQNAEKALEKFLEAVRVELRRPRVKVNVRVEYPHRIVSLPAAASLSDDSPSVYENL